MLHGKQEALILTLSREKRNIVFHKNILCFKNIFKKPSMTFKATYKQIFITNFQVNDDFR